ncbi:MAG: hypothetical protein ACSHXB_20490 [Sulfitobacter sp.]
MPPALFIVTFKGSERLNNHDGIIFVESHRRYGIIHIKLIFPSFACRRDSDLECILSVHPSAAKHGRCQSELTAIGRGNKKRYLFVTKAENLMLIFESPQGDIHREPIYETSYSPSRLNFELNQDKVQHQLFNKLH